MVLDCKLRLQQQLALKKLTDFFLKIPKLISWKRRNIKKEVFGHDQSYSTHLDHYADGEDDFDILS